MGEYIGHETRAKVSYVHIAGVCLLTQHISVHHDGVSIHLFFGDGANIFLPEEELAGDGEAINAGAIRLEGQVRTGIRTVNQNPRRKIRSEHTQESKIIGSKTD